MFATCFEEWKCPRNAAGTSTIAPSAAFAQVRGLHLWDIFHPRISQHVTCVGHVRKVQILLSCHFNKWRNRDAEHRGTLERLSQSWDKEGRVLFCMLLRSPPRRYLDLKTLVFWKHLLTDNAAVKAQCSLWKSSS